MSGEDGADDEHHSHHPEGADHEGDAAAEPVDPDDEKDAGGDDFDCSVDASGEERGVGCGESDGLEDLRCVVTCSN